jgi:hypothetical protein
LNVIYELRCPKCKGFISGYPEALAFPVRGRCRACRLTFEDRPVARGLDIAVISIRTFA